MSELTPTESDLHAYLDGQLDAERRQWIEAWLASHPQEAR
ncbi:anti-sigma factor family protein, partial [Pseudomonas sp. HMSC75E02]